MVYKTLKLELFYQTYSQVRISLFKLGITMAHFLFISVVLVAALVVCVNANTSPKCYGQNEEWYRCGACDSKCGVQVSCVQSCREGSCGCKRGYVRNNGVCIWEKNCPGTSKCGPNEELKGCGACDGTCKNRDVMCTMDCRPPECGCIKGYVRNDDRKCVPPSQCPFEPK